MRSTTTTLCTAALLGLGAAGCGGGVTIQTDGAARPAASAQPPANDPSSTGPAPTIAPLPALQVTQTPAPVQTTTQAPAPPQPVKTLVQAPPPQRQSGCPDFTPGVASAVGSTLIQYFDGITSGDYSDAWNLLTSGDKSRVGGYSTFANGDSSSTDRDITYHGESMRSNCQVAAEVTFTSYQAASLSPNGEDDCDNWDLVYYLTVQSGGYWLIDDAQPAHGNGWSSCD